MSVLRGQSGDKVYKGMGRVICTKCGVRSMYTTNIIKKHQARGKLKALWNTRTISHMDKQYRAGYLDGFYRNISNKAFLFNNHLYEEQIEMILAEIHSGINKYRELDNLSLDDFCVEIAMQLRAGTQTIPDIAKATALSSEAVSELGKKGDNIIDKRFGVKRGICWVDKGNDNEL